MKVFIYELMTGGGPLDAGPPPAASFLREGTAMMTAVAADFAAVEGVAVQLLHDARLGVPDIAGCSVYQAGDARQACATFDVLAAAADWTVVIAPEWNDLLLDRARRVEEMGGRLLGPSPDLIRLTSNKERTARTLAAAGVAVAAGQTLLPGEALPVGFSYPAVVKPLCGAGSLDLALVRGPADGPRQDTAPRRLEPFYPGVPASVALLCGPGGCVPLAACRQNLSDDGRFAYLGGELPLPDPLAARAHRLAQQVAAALPQPLGYLGIDMVLDTAADGHGDVVIEVNPRLTTSYVGLRAAAEDNLADAMLTIARGGRTVPTFRAGTVRFTAEGEVRVGKRVSV